MAESVFIPCHPGCNKCVAPQMPCYQIFYMPTLFLLCNFNTYTNFCHILALVHTNVTPNKYVPVLMSPTPTYMVNLSYFFRDGGGGQMASYLICIPMLHPSLYFRSSVVKYAMFRIPQWVKVLACQVY